MDAVRNIRKITLGPKGRVPIKKQRNPRKTSKVSSMTKFINDFHDGDQKAAEASIFAYQNGSATFKEALLMTWIHINGLTLRIAKDIFKIGAFKYERLKTQRPKLKTGGPRGNFVC